MTRLGLLKHSKQSGVVTLGPKLNFNTVTMQLCSRPDRHSAVPPMKHDDESSIYMLSGPSPCTGLPTWASSGQNLGCSANLDGVPQRRASPMHLQAAHSSRKQRCVLQRSPDHRLYATATRRSFRSASGCMLHYRASLCL